jgi:hypothetical protein
MQVRDFLFAQSELNLSTSDAASVASNVIYLIELLPPPKAAVLAFLDSNGSAPAPPRQVCLFQIKSRPLINLCSHDVGAQA